MALVATCALFLLLTTCSQLVIGDFDLLKPILRLSPDLQNNGDHFGYSAIAHQLFSNSTGMSYEEILSQTVIVSGAPYGIYPGGLNLPLDWRVCQNHRDSTDNCMHYNMLLEGYNDSQIQECYQRLRSGLVYSCSLTSGNCDSLMSGSPLFDSIGNYYDDCNHNRKPSKTNQLMGSFLYSNGKYLVACAPQHRFDSYINSMLQSAALPVGQCVLIDRNLTQITGQYSACSTFALGLNQERGFCNSGMSSVIIDEQLVMGAPTDSARGIVKYFPNLAVNTHTQYPRPPTSQTDGYLGYFVTSGNITSNSHTNVIASQPNYRDTNGVPIGRVTIYEQTSIVQSLTGYQGGEYFGYTIASIDLNGDGWDDLLVGAPFYTRFTSPIQVVAGRVFVFTRHDNGTLIQSGVLYGSASNGQFGTAIANIGDVNNDGFEDCAISAPFEGSGVVYIYYGQAMDQQGYIVKTTVQQRIDGSSLVNQVSNLTSVSSFGFSLSGSVDVDQNEYRDLVIGAFESQAVFVLQSIPIAVTSISISTNITEVRLNSYQCNYNGMPITCFYIAVCSQYTGKGIEGGFSTTYQLREVTVSGQASRLFFTSPSSNSMTQTITYPSVGVPVCKENILVYVHNTTDISDFKLRAEVQRVVRDNSSVNTNTFPVDLSSSPDVKGESGSIAIQVATECGDDRICDSDLNIAISKVTYRDHQDIMTTDQSQYVIGNASIVDLTLMISNTAEDAFQPYISLDVSQTYFTGVQSLNGSIRCNGTSQNGTIATYTCTGIKTPLTISDGMLPVILRLQANTSLMGNELPVDIPVSVNIPLQTRNRENASFIEDNTDSVRISFIATLSYTVKLFYLSGSSITYFGNGTNNVNNIASNLGQRLNMLMTLRNDGPSPYTGTLNLYIPARNRQETRSNYYYYYPVELMLTDTGGSTIQCDQSSLNPDNYNTDEETTNRNRRSLAKRGYSRTLNKRETTVYNLDCQATPDMCIKVQCNVTDLRRSTVTAQVRGYVDERFFRDETETYNFRAFADGSINDGFTLSNGSERDATANIAFNRLIIIPGDTGGDFPYIYLIIPIVFAIIFIILLAVALYCLGFFKRRKTKKEQEEMDPYEDGYDPQNDDEVKDPKEFSTTL